MLPLPAQHSWAGRRGRKRPRDGRPTRAVPGVAAQTTPAQTVSWSIPITIYGFIQFSDQFYNLSTPGVSLHPFHLSIYMVSEFNSLAPGRFKVNFRWVIFKLILMVNDWGICCETTLIWVSLDHTYDKSTLVQVMAWCRQATSHYLSQCWPRSLPPYGITKPQWVKSKHFKVMICRDWHIKSFSFASFPKFCIFQKRRYNLEQNLTKIRLSNFLFL